LNHSRSICIGSSPPCSVPALRAARIIRMFHVTAPFG
jgi:hypothetical protein